MELFCSHSWYLSIATIAGQALGFTHNSHFSQSTYDHALRWGAAHPDSSGCWSGNQTFETCCVHWNGAPPGTCWDGSRTYESCCVAKTEWAPRSFSCNDKGLYWQRLRQTLSLFRVFTELRETPLDQASPKECLIGGVLSSMLSLIHVGHYRQYRTQEQKDEDYDRAESLLLTLFSSPVTLEEILVSGWPLFISLDLFRFDEAFQQMAHKRLPLQPPKEHTIKWSETVVKAVQNGQGRRIPVDTVLKLVNSITKSGDMGLAQLVPILTSLVEIHNLRNYQLPRAEQGEEAALAMEAKRLFSFVGMLLRQWFAAVRRPFSLLMNLKLPLVTLLQSLSWPSVVLTHPGKLLQNSVHFPGGLLRKIVPSFWKQSFPLLVQHVHPGFDAVSNMLRATEQPMCYQEGFLQLALALAVVGETEANIETRIWDVGASYGDCLLWVSAVLDGFSHLELRGFEPLPAQAAAFGRSARLSPKDIVVERIALRDEPGTLDIGFPSHSMALATFQSCQRQYEVPSNYEYQCISRSTKAETLDNYLMTLAPSGPIDLLKIHVQGDELAVLHGANTSFTSGKICALHLNLEHFYLTPGAAMMVSNLLRRSRFLGILVNIWEVQPLSFRHLKAAMLRRQPFWRRGQRPPQEDMQHELVAWSTAESCQRSLVVAAAQRLWASHAGFL